MARNKKKPTKEAWGFWSTVVGALITGIVALIVAYKPSIPLPTPTPTMTLPVATSPAIVASSSTEIPNWAITFEYRFPAGFWTVGAHEYTLTTSCPSVDLDGKGFHGSSQKQTFQVSESAALLPGDVYLRLTGLRDESFEPGNGVDVLNPMQTTTAVINLYEMPQADAILAVTDCTITIMWDGSAPKQLKPGAPYQH